MSRFDSVDFGKVTDNLLDDIYGELDDIRSSLQDKLRNITYKEEMFWNGSYSGLLQVEEFIRYLFYSEPISNDDIDFELHDRLPEKEEFSERVKYITKHMAETIDSIDPVTSFLYGQVFCLHLFYDNVKELDEKLSNDCDFEEFHVQIKGLIPSVSDHLNSEDNLDQLYKNTILGD